MQFTPKVLKVLCFLSALPTLTVSLRRHRNLTPLVPDEKLYVYKKVAIKNVARASRSIRMPHLLPLLFGNHIQGYKKSSHGYEIKHSSEDMTELFPLKKKIRQTRSHAYTSGFVFKRSTLSAHPVPMQNSIVVVRLTTVSRRFGSIHLWLTSSGIYNHAQRRKQMLYSKGLLQNFADNIQRAFGVRACSNYPTPSGLCNNRENELSGVTFQPFLEETKFLRKATAELTSISPNPRMVSDSIVKTTHSRPASKMTNLLLVIFGQFIDHEITATPSEDLDKESSAPIPHPSGSKLIKFKRSGILRLNYRECCAAKYSTKRVWEGSPFNVLTSFIDGGAIYSSDPLRAYILRSFKGGELIMKRRNGEVVLPFNTEKDLEFVVENEGVGHSEGDLFVAGDVRANENPVLLAIHTMFAREHNRVCRMLRNWVGKRRRKSLLRDDWIYKQAKQIVIAELQSITFNEFVPAMLGEDALGKYRKYKPKLDSRISTLHASVAFRWGHSGVTEEMKIKDRKGASKTRRLRDMFFNTKVFDEHGVDNLLLSAMNTAAADIDVEIVESLRNFLFHPDSEGTLDLAAMNIQRSRDVGVPSYDNAQKLFGTGAGLQNIRKELLQKLLQVYGNYYKIDAFIGGLAEKPVDGSLLGPLFHAINVDQFKRLRDGDRFYYENIHWHPAIRNIPLVQRIRRHEIGFIDIMLANTNLSLEDIGARETLFKTSQQQY